MGKPEGMTPEEMAWATVDAECPHNGSYFSQSDCLTCWADLIRAYAEQEARRARAEALEEAARAAEACCNHGRITAVRIRALAPTARKEEEG